MTSKKFIEICSAQRRGGYMHRVSDELIKFSLTHRSQSHALNFLPHKVHYMLRQIFHFKSSHSCTCFLRTDPLTNFQDTFLQNCLMESQYKIRRYKLAGSGKGPMEESGVRKNYIFGLFWSLSTGHEQKIGLCSESKIQMWQYGHLRKKKKIIAGVSETKRS